MHCLYSSLVRPGHGTRRGRSSLLLFLKHILSLRCIVGISSLRHPQLAMHQHYPITKETSGSEPPGIKVTKPPNQSSNRLGAARNPIVRSLPRLSSYRLPEARDHLIMSGYRVHREIVFHNETRVAINPLQPKQYLSPIVHVTKKSRVSVLRQEQRRSSKIIGASCKQQLIQCRGASV